MIKQADGAKMTGGNVRREAFVEAATAAELLETLGQMRATVRPTGLQPAEVGCREVGDQKVSCDVFG